jgi:phosphohistidine phosphatase
MKRLLLIRHAKSSWDDPALRDFDRPLNERGVRDAPRMAKRLKEKQIHPDLMVSSPAVRALATCKAMAAVLKYSESKIKTYEALYHASEDTLLEVVRQLPDYADREEVALLFGHNPGLTDFANQLLDANIDNIPTCGIVACTFRLQHWKDVTWGSAKMDFFDFPKNKVD